MATVAAVIASTHHPFYYRASTSTGADRPPFADEWVEKIERFRETLTRARPDVLVMVGSDHFHQLWLDNMPQFLVGKAPFFDANWYNEEREFGLPRMTLPGQVDLASHILRNGLDRNFDLAFSNELRIDHSITCPIITLRPQGDLPIVPIYTNIFAPPLPQPRRFVELGRTIRELVESWPSDLRVAIIGTGHLSLELGGPRQFGPHGPDPEFDRKAVEWIATSNVVRLSGRGDAGQPAPARQCHPRLHGLHADDGGGRRERGRRSRRQLSTSFTPWRPISPGIRASKGGRPPLNPPPRAQQHTGAREIGAGNEQVPPRQVPLHRRPRPRVWSSATARTRPAPWPGGRLEMANTILNCVDEERSTWLAFEPEERRALTEHDHVRLFELGAHPFLTLTLFIAMFERDHGPLEYQIAYGQAMSHLQLPYPDIAT